MTKRKLTNEYHFTVEGESEKWYLEWLEQEINKMEVATHKVKFNCKIQRNPVKYIKSLNITSKIEIIHLSDFESDDPQHQDEFKFTLDKMREATKLGKSVQYKFGYSNLTFELWLILHNRDCNGHIGHRRNYLAHINKTFDEDFESLDEFKREPNYKRCLDKLQIKNVQDAIRRSRVIMKRNEENGYRPINYKNFIYYKENPSLMVGELISIILANSGLK